MELSEDINMLEIRYVKETDKDFWYCLDKHLPERDESAGICSSDR